MSMIYIEKSRIKESPDGEYIVWIIILFVIHTKKSEIVNISIILVL